MNMHSPSLTGGLRDDNDNGKDRRRASERIWHPLQRQLRRITPISAAAGLLLLFCLAVVIPWNSRTYMRFSLYGGGGQHFLTAGSYATLAEALSASIASADAATLQRVLFGTGMAFASTGDLLDLTKGRLSGQQRRALVRMQQTAYCSANLHTEWRRYEIARLLFGNSSVYVHNQNDIVSGSLIREHAWETKELNEMLWALKAPLHGLDADRDSRYNTPLMVDVGANVGWFTLNAAAAGARVAAFEGMPDNLRVLRTSLCYNSWLMDRVALYGTGVGDQDNTCYILSGNQNKGNGNTVCGGDVNAAIEKFSQSDVAPGFKMNYTLRGQMTIRRMDEILDEDVKVMKIDIEGYELPALHGAMRLFQHRRIWFILTELNQPVIGRDGAIRYLQFLTKLGYAISLYSFKGPFLPELDIRAGQVLSLGWNTIVNLFCVRQDWLDVSGLQLPPDFTKLKYAVRLPSANKIEAYVNKVNSTQPPSALAAAVSRKDFP